MHLYCLGSGSPTVILEAGSGCPWYLWGPVQRAAAQYSRVCSYDRAGYGLSELGPNPRTGKVVAEELQTLLHAAGIKPPYLLVGHSLGGMFIRVFEALYPSQVKGLILVDSVHEEQHKRLPRFPDQSPSLWQRLETFFARHFDFVKDWVIEKDKTKYPIPPDFSDVQLTYAFDLMMRSNIEEATTAEGKSVDGSADDLKKMDRKLGNKPLIVVSQGKPDGVTADMDEEYAAKIKQMNKVWPELQLELVQLSSNSRHLIAKESGHMIPLYQPQIIVDAIRDMVQDYRKSHPVTECIAGKPSVCH
ncbi:MAG: alpha/beta hydrolase [Myxococcota bacterium]